MKAPFIFGYLDLFIQACEAGVFDDEVVFDAVFGAFTTEAGLLHTAERCDFVGNQTSIDADHAVFKCFRYAENTTNITAVEIRGEAEFGVVGIADDFIFTLEFEQWCQWAKGFFFCDSHVLCDVGENGWLEE